MLWITNYKMIVLHITVAYNKIELIANFINKNARTMPALLI